MYAHVSKYNTRSLLYFLPHLKHTTHGKIMFKYYDCPFPQMTSVGLIQAGIERPDTSWQSMEH